MAANRSCNKPPGFATASIGFVSASYSTAPLLTELPISCLEKKSDWGASGWIPVPFWEEVLPVLCCCSGSGVFSSINAGGPGTQRTEGRTICADSRISRAVQGEFEQFWSAAVQVIVFYWWIFLQGLKSCRLVSSWRGEKTVLMFHSSIQKPDFQAAFKTCTICLLPSPIWVYWKSPNISFFKI